MQIGYARASANDQNLALQRDALKAAERRRIVMDQGVSSSVADRPGLDRALAAFSSGDSLVVWKLDRFGRSLAHLVQTVAELGSRGVGFRSLSDPIDTTSAGSCLALHMVGALVEFERSLIVERIQAGLQVAKQRGQKLGRKPKLTPAQVAHARRLIDGGESPRTVARSFRVARSMLYRHLPGGSDAPTPSAEGRRRGEEHAR